MDTCGVGEQTKLYYQNSLEWKDIGIILLIKKGMNLCHKCYILKTNHNVPQRQKVFELMGMQMRNFITAHLSLILYR